MLVFLIKDHGDSKRKHETSSLVLSMVTASPPRVAVTAPPPRGSSGPADGATSSELRVQVSDLSPAHCYCQYLLSHTLLIPQAGHPASSGCGFQVLPAVHANGREVDCGARGNVQGQGDTGQRLTCFWKLSVRSYTPFTFMLKTINS